MEVETRIRQAIAGKNTKKEGEHPEAAESNPCKHGVCEYGHAMRNDTKNHRFLSTTRGASLSFATPK